jgi:uncharacterized damage-inducible protein DinB
MSTPSPQGSPLSAVVADELCFYFSYLATRVERAARSLPPERLWARPFPFGNSVGHLVLHLTGNLNHYVGNMIAGTGYVRDRPGEFTDPAEEPIDVILDRFHDAVAMVVRTIRSLGDEGLMTPVADQRPIRTRFGLLLVCAAHMNNHIGQMSYLVQAQGQGTQEPPVW